MATDLHDLARRILDGQSAERALRAHWRQELGLPEPITFALDFRAPPKANLHKIARRGGGRRRVVNDLTGVLAKQEESFAERALAELSPWQREGLPWGGPISVGVTFVYRVTDSWPEWQKEAALRGSFRMTKTPDLDNLLKFVWDSLQGVFLADDKNIHRYDWLEKRYGHKEQVLVTLEQTPQATAETWEDLPV